MKHSSLLAGLYPSVEPTLGAKTDVSFDLGNHMDVQERHITNRAIASLDIRVCHSLPALTGQLDTELAFPSFKET
ncbi:hypothetical protein J6590_043195 [Homalodisca vitripennis]|nr:hypothetical protein J6590_043195 [Homalodisca vitripennis]